MTKMDEPAKWISPQKDSREDGVPRNDLAAKHERELERRKRERLGLQPNDPLPEEEEHERED